MRLFDPARDAHPGACMPCSLPDPDVFSLRLAGEDGAPLPPLPLFSAVRTTSDVLIPRREDCLALWDRYAVPSHIRDHSELVAGLACAMAERAAERGLRVMPELALAAGLLHDIGKMYCIKHGGNHAQLGASWTMRETRNGAAARAVLFHVHWPWDDLLDACLENDDFFVVMAVIYADKRVKHGGYVTMDERFADLQERYGVNEYARSRIEQSRRQGKRVEAAFSRRLGISLDEYAAEDGRLVKRIWGQTSA
jgi:putative nucleotidyltransferase with HDIG domain